ncbi:MAG: insulinase family protein [Acidobacteria bacterium]|nr:insulinase family protein [Acidobacteriota bacterium]
MKNSVVGLRWLLFASHRPNSAPRFRQTINHGQRPISLTGAVILLLACLLTSILTWAQETTWQKVPVPPLPAFHPNEPRRIALANGMILFLQEDHELPLINGFARIRGGSYSEPANRAGLVELYGEVWRTGGTKSETGDQLDDFLEARAAKVETGDGGESTSIGLSCLKQDFDDVFKVFVDLLQNPEFRADKLQLAQSEAFDAISRRNDDIGEIVNREAAKLGYGGQSPYARIPEYATIAAISRQDLLDWHRAHVSPNNIILGFSGDFESGAMEAKLRQAFGGWPKGAAIKGEEFSIAPAQPGYYLVNKEDVTQSAVRLIETGTTRRNPDYYAIAVFNEAFGGGFGSRLFSNIRSILGLAYSVGGGVGTGWDHPALSRFGADTKSQSTVESIQALYHEIGELKTNPINDEEMRRAKDSILNSFIFNFDTPEKVLREKMAYEFFGYPLDFLERYRSGIEKVTTADVAKIPPKYLHSDTMRVLVVGHVSEFDKPLTSLGTVTPIDITIPPPPGQASPTKISP